MKTLYSFFLWSIGIAFFLLSAVIIGFCLFVLPKRNTFSTARFLFRILLWMMRIKLEVYGKQNIKSGQPYIIMGNHQSMFDLFVVPTAIPLTFSAVEAAYHFSIPVWGHLIKKWGVIPIERHDLGKAMKSLELAKKTLASGMDIAVLPEGHRTLTGEMAPFKKGPFHMAKDTQADILPFGINGLFDYNKKGSFLLNPGVVKVNIGVPVKRSQIDKMSVEELRDTLFDTIKGLSKK